MFKNFLILTILFFSTGLFAFSAEVYKPKKVFPNSSGTTFNQGYMSPNIYQKNYSFNQDEMSGPEQILIVMDSSYSMSEEIGGISKMDIAKNALNGVLSELSPNLNIGLRIYGHRAGFYECSASELVCPIRKNNISAIKQKVNRLRPTGSTPIIYSLRQALAGDFSYNANKRIILISDGVETCEGSLCDFAVDLVKRGVKVKIDVIGFDLNELGALDQLKCVALSTKAKFYSANTAAELKNSLSNSLNVTKEVEGKIIY